MSVNFNQFFSRQGAFIGEYNRVTAFYGSSLDAGFSSIWSQFATSDQAAVANLPDAVAAFRSTDSQYLNTLVQDGQLAALLEVNDDTSVVPYTFQQATLVLIGQMIAGSQSIQRATLSSSVTPAGTNLGDSTIAVSTTNQYGDPLDMIFTEDVTVTCTANSGSSYQAQMNAVGEAALPSYSPYWPGGSGANQAFSINDPAVNGIVTDGGFENWGGSGNNTPTNWTIVDGSAGVTVTRGTGGVRGAYTAQIVSDGSQPTQLAQNVNLTVNSVYMVTVEAKINTVDASGAFVMSLTDADGNILQDDAGNNLTYTRNLNGQVTTSFQTFTAFFATPRQLPTTVRVQYGYDSAPTSGRTLTLDLAAVVAATQLYNGGPFMAGVAGADRTALADYYTAAFSNSLGTQSFARGCDRLFGFRNLGLYYPSSLSPTQADSKVTH